MSTSREKSYLAAQKFQQKGQLDKAISELERLIQEDPTDVRTLLKIGDLHVRRQDVPAAIATYTQVAETYRDQGFALKAIAVYKQVVHLDPVQAAVTQQLGTLYESLGLTTDAAAQYRALLGAQKAQGLWPDTVAVLQKLIGYEGETQELLVQWAEVHKALGDIPEVKRTLNRVAEACLTQNRLDDWAQVAEELLRVDPDLTGLACELAKHYLGREQPKAALLKLQAAFRAAPQDTETLTLLAQVFEALGQWPKAVAVLHELGAQAHERGQLLALQRIAAHILRLDAGDAQATAWASPREAEAEAKAQVLKQHRPVPLPQEPAASQPPPAPRTANRIDLTNLLIEASVFARYGLFARATEYLERVLTAFPDHAEARAQYEAIKARATEAEAQAQATHRNVLAQGPTHTPESELVQNPLAAADVGDLELTIDLFDAAPEQGPTAVSLDALIAEALPDAAQNGPQTTSLDKHFDALLSQEEGAAKLAPPTSHVDDQDHETQFNLGIAYREMGLFNDALSQFKKLVDIDAFAINARAMMALCLVQMARHPEAQAVLAEALALPQASPHERAALHYDMGQTLLEAGDAPGSQAHFRAAFEVDPNFRDVAQRVTA